MNKLRKSVSICFAVATALTLVKKLQLKEAAKAPVNEELHSTVVVDGKQITIYVVDHLQGETISACSSKSEKFVKITRKLLASASGEAVLSHEIGHIVEADTQYPWTSTSDLIRLELQADNYAVKNGHLDGLLKLRARQLVYTICDPFAYNNVCCVVLVAKKVKSFF